jgi:hypothetical protein
MFVDRNDVAYLARWRTQFMAAAGTGKEGERSTFQDAMTDFLSTNNPDSLVQYLLGSDSTVEQICIGSEALADKSQWVALARLRPLLTKIDTARTIELVAYSDYRTGSFEESLNLLHSRADRFKGGRLPLALRRLEAEAAVLAGKPSVALDIAAAIQAETGDANVAIRQAQLSIAMGDTRGAADIVLKLKDRADVNPTDLLELASAIQHERPTLARSVVEDLSSVELRPEALTRAVGLAIELGTESAQRILMSRFFALSAEGRIPGVIKIDSVEQALAMIDAQTQNAAHRREQWILGNVPAHVAFEGDFQRFASLYLAEPDDPDAIGRNGYPMLVRSGAARAKERSDRPTVTVANIRVDISALLLAWHFDMIDLLDHFPAVRVPLDIGAALLNLEHAFRLDSDKFAHDRKQVISLVEAGVLQLFSDASETKGAQRVARPPEADEPWDQTLISSAIQLAITKGHIDRGSGESALLKLRIGAESATAAAITAVETFGIVMDGPHAIALQSAGLLRPLLDALPLVGVPHPQLLLMREAAARYQREKSRHDAIVQLRTHVAERLRTGQWEAIPHRPLSDGNEKHLEKWSPVLRCLLSMVIAGNAENTLAWIEDRAASVEGALGNVPRVDVVDILDDLLEANVIDRRRRDVLVARLRDGGYGYLAVEPDYAASMLDDAPIVDGEVIETPELRSLRVWYAREVDRLRWANSKTLEVRHTTRIWSLAQDTVREIWLTSLRSHSEKIALCRFAWRLLRFDQIDFLPVNNTAESRRNMVAMALAYLLQAPLFPKINKLSDDDQSTFLTWACEDIVNPMLKAEPGLEEPVVSLIAASLSNLFEINETEPNRVTIARHMAALVISYLRRMPSPWKERLQGREQLATRLGIRTLSTIMLEIEIELEVTEFVRAVTATFDQDQHNSKMVSAPLLRGKGKAKFKLDEHKGEPATITVIAHRKELLLDPLYTSFLDPDPQRRVQRVRTISTFADLPAAIVSEILEGIAINHDPLARLERIGTIQAGDLVQRFERLRAQLRQGQEIKADLLTPPHPDSIARFLRLGAAADITNQSLI